MTRYRSKGQITSALYDMVREGFRNDAIIVWFWKYMHTNESTQRITTTIIEDYVVYNQPHDRTLSVYNLVCIILVYTLQDCLQVISPTKYINNLHVACNTYLSTCRLTFFFKASEIATAPPSEILLSARLERSDKVQVKGQITSACIV